MMSFRLFTEKHPKYGYILTLSFVFRVFNVHEVLSMLEDDDTFDQADIFIEPPPVREETDEDNGEEDGEGVPSNLNWNQLSAGASVTVLRAGVRSTIGDEDPEEAVSLFCISNILIGWGWG